MIASGMYEGQAIKGSVQLGETNNGGLQMALNMEVFDAKGASLGQMTTFLYFTDASAVYSYERLRLMGWKGQSAEDIDKLDEIYSTKVPVKVTAPEPYTDPVTKTQKMGSAKLEIVAGGTVTLNKPLDASTFKARLKAIGGGAPASASGGAPKPPF